MISKLLESSGKENQRQRTTEDFLSETMQTERQQNKIFKVLRKHFQSRFQGLVKMFKKRWNTSIDL